MPPHHKDIPTATKRTSKVRRRAPRFLHDHFLGIHGAKYSEDQLEFMLALDTYKSENRRPFPTCSEVLAVFYALGYRKVAEPSPVDVQRKDGKPI